MITSISLLVDLFFGRYPARKAAGVDPIVALRHERGVAATDVVGSRTSVRPNFTLDAFCIENVVIVRFVTMGDLHISISIPS